MTNSSHIYSPAIILVEPQLGENIGMAARAMLNCGLTDLRLVNPRDGWPSEAAQRSAAGADTVLENTKLFDTIADAVADKSFVLASTARSRDMIKPVYSPETGAQTLIAHDKKMGQSASAILYGREKSGLKNDDLSYADAILHVPLNPTYSSLNLAQAVLLIGYQWYKQAVVDPDVERQATLDVLELGSAEVTTKEDLEILMRHFEVELDNAKYFSTPEIRVTNLRNIRNAFQRMRLTDQELRTFHGMLKSLSGNKKWDHKS
jgi:tRNA/rRNA methyltransferase